MTYSVYSLNFSSLFPQQSEYLMMITLYFLLSICWTLLSMMWFIIYTYITTKADMPKFLYVFCARLQKALFCCFPSPSWPDTKAAKNKKVIVQNDDTKTVGSQEIQEATSTQRTTCLCCQKSFASCFQRRNRVEGTTNEQRVTVEDSESFSPNPTACIPTNQINEQVKPKCSFCNKCQTCQAAVDKERAKGKNKKDIEDCCNVLNYLVFFVVLSLMIASNLAIWLIMSQWLIWDLVVLSSSHSLSSTITIKM